MRKFKNSLNGFCTMKTWAIGALAKQYLCVWCLVLVSVTAAQENNRRLFGDWKVSIENYDDIVLLKTNQVLAVSLTIYDVDLSRSSQNFDFYLITADPVVAYVNSYINRNDLIVNNTTNLAYWQGEISIYAQNFGVTQLYIILRSDDYIDDQLTIEIEVLRAQRLDEKIFKYSASGVALLMFLNLGTVLDLTRFKKIFMRPIGPAIAAGCRLLVMPLIGIFMGKLFFPQDQTLQLALFFSCLSPGGGLANIANVFLKGNIDLSLAATTVTSLMALIMLPLWILLVAGVFFKKAQLEVPVMLIVGLIAIILSLFLGILLRFCLPKLTAFLVRYLKPLSIVLSLCLVALTVIINIFAFQQLTFMIFAAAMCLPAIAFTLTFGMGKLWGMSSNDCMTIALETSIINMTAPIVLLQTSLDAAKSDLTLVLPILTALMSLLLVLVFYFIQRAMIKSAEKNPQLIFTENELNTTKIDLTT